jgi:hypothetical protein
MKADVLAGNTAGLFTFETMLASAAGYEGNNRDAVTDFEAVNALADSSDFAGRINTQHVWHLNLNGILTGTNDQIQCSVDRNRMDF